LWNNNLYDTCITKFVNPSSAGDFACSAGELEIESESWSVQPKAGDLASMHLIISSETRFYTKFINLNSLVLKLATELLQFQLAQTMLLLFSKPRHQTIRQEQTKQIPSEI